MFYWFKSFWGFIVCFCFFWHCLYKISYLIQFPIWVFLKYCDGKPRWQIFRNVNKLLIVIVNTRVLVSRGWSGQQKVTMEPGKSILLSLALRRELSKSGSTLSCELLGQKNLRVIISLRRNKLHHWCRCLCLQEFKHDHWIVGISL